MKAELQKKLFDKYPKIFKQKDDDMRTTCMCWGIETGDGWYALIDSLCGHLQGMSDNNPDHASFPQIEAVQVKEKFGTLRFYTNGASEWQDGVIAFAESISAKICDVCGKAGTLNRNGWIACRCPEHKESYELEENESAEEAY